MRTLAILGMLAMLTGVVVGCNGEKKDMRSDNGVCPAEGSCPKCGAVTNEGGKCLRCDMTSSDYGQRQASDVAAQPGSTCVIEPSGSYQPQQDLRSDQGTVCPPAQSNK